MASAPSLHFCMRTQPPSTSCIANHGHRLFHVPTVSVNIRPLSSRCSVTTCARRRTSSSIASSKKKKQSLHRNIVDKEEFIEEDAFEALFKLLEEDLKNDGLSFDDDDEITEEDLIKLERELEEALTDDELLGLFDDTEDDKNEVEAKDKKVMNRKGTTVNEVIEKEIEISKFEEENEDGDDGPLELKRWQLRRLAYALKIGRRKTNILLC